VLDALPVEAVVAHLMGVRGWVKSTERQTGRQVGWQACN
jgi:hypothetical protein